MSQGQFLSDFVTVVSLIFTVRKPTASSPNVPKFFSHSKLPKLHLNILVAIRGRFGGDPKEGGPINSLETGPSNVIIYQKFRGKFANKSALKLDFPGILESKFQFFLKAGHF